MYHSLQTQIQKRLSDGFAINLTHTWSKLLDAITFLSPGYRTPWSLRFAGIRQDGQATWNFSAIKNIQLRDSVQLQLRADCFNGLNHPNFNAANVTPTSTAFGIIASQNGGGRQFTVAGRIQF